MPDVWTQAASATLADLLVTAASEKLFVWDFDGVVADTEPLHDTSYRILADRRGWTPDDGYFLAMVGQTEPVIWSRLFESGLPAHGEQITDVHDLIAARREVFFELAEQNLNPSWLSAVLMPALHAAGATQVIVSNGDHATIERLLRKWALDPFVSVARRNPGSDKRALLQERLSQRTVLLEDDARWLALGRSAGAVTVAVRHEYNRAADIAGDFTVEL